MISWEYAPKQFKLIFRFFQIFITMQIQSLPLLLCLRLVFQISNCERLDFESWILHVNWFFEGMNLELYCQQDAANDIYIESPTQGIVVEGSRIVDGVADKFEFQKNSTVGVLVIKRLSKNDDGIDICSEAGGNEKFAQVNVLYSPSNRIPHCMSNLDTSVIFDDLRQDFINFTCITHEGNPHVLITLDIFQSNGTYNVSDVSKLCTKYQNVNDKSLSFNCHLNESLNNTLFLCSVTQQFNYSFSEGFNSSCSFGPLLFLPTSFSITINETNVTVMEGKGVNLTCTTNVPEAEIKWIGIPVDWEYNETKDGYFSHLWITQAKKQSTSEITVQCIGYYGNRNATDGVKFNIINVQSNRDKLVTGIPVIVVTIGIITFLTAGVFIVCFHWMRTLSNIHRERVDQITYTTTVMAPNEIMEENIDGLQGSQEIDCSVVTVHSPGDNSNTKYYEIPLQSSRLDEGESGYLVPTSAHPQSPLYQYVDNL